MIPTPPPARNSRMRKPQGKSICKGDALDIEYWVLSVSLRPPRNTIASLPPPHHPLIDLQPRSPNPVSTYPPTSTHKQCRKLKFFIVVVIGQKDWPFIPKRKSGFPPARNAESRFLFFLIGDWEIVIEKK